jgi:hypothetical protein
MVQILQERDAQVLLQSCSIQRNISNASMTHQSRREKNISKRLIFSSFAMRRKKWYALDVLLETMPTVKQQCQREGA